MAVLNNGFAANNSFINNSFKKLKFSHFYWSAGDRGITIDSFAKKHSEWGPLLLVPLISTVILALTVFLLIIFRQNPTLVISTVVGCIFFIAIYLILYAVDSSKEILA